MDSSHRALTAASDGVREPVSGLRAVRLAAIKSDIVRNLRQPALSIHGVASRHGITAVYLRRLFEAEGTSFAKFVMAQRLEAAHAVLSDRRMTQRRISEVAFEVGFGDVVQFNRAFRRRYGVKPTELQAQVRGD